jgi:hypothetical protein
MHQSNQLQSQMQALNQNHMQALHDGSQNSVMNQMQNQMQIPNQMQNPMQGQLQNSMQSDSQQLQDLELSGNQDALQQALVGASQEQSMNESDGMGSQDLIDQDIPEDDVDLDDENDQNDEGFSEQAENDPDASKPVENISQQLDDNSNRSTGSKSKRRTSASDASASNAAPRTPMGPRGRGGKGKRLREMADDLMPGPGAATSFDGTLDIGSSNKRSSDDMDGDNEGEPLSKLQKMDSDAPAPDTEKSSGPDEDGNGEGRSSLASSMPKGDVEQHLLMLHKGLHLTSRTITHKCLPIVQQLIDDPYGWVFRDAVDPVVFGLPDYFEVVKNPMHLLLVKKKLENAVYTDMASFERDVKLVFENAILYNGEESEVGTLAKTMMGVFEKEYQKVCEGM